MAASEAPPTQMGGCGRPGSEAGRMRETSVNETNVPWNEALVLGPQGLDGGQVLVGHRAPPVERHPHGLGLQPRVGVADPDPEDEPPATEGVDIGGQSRHEDGMTVGQHADRGAELHPPRLSGHPGQRREGIVEGLRVALADVRRHGHMVRDHHGVVADILGETRPSPERVRADPRTKVEDIHANLHERTLSSSRTLADPRELDCDVPLLGTVRQAWPRDSTALRPDFDGAPRLGLRSNGLLGGKRDRLSIMTTVVCALCGTASPHLGPPTVTMPPERRVA